MGISEKDFEIIFKKYFVAITSYCNHFLGDVDEAKDIAHRAFLKVWEKRDAIPEGNNIPALLYKISHNLSINYLRDNKKFTSNEDIQLQEADSHEADSDIKTAELESAIIETVNNLPDKIKRVFIMSRYDKLSNGQIADQLNISVKTVEAHITTALKALRLKIYGKEK